MILPGNDFDQMTGIMRARLTWTPRFCMSKNSFILV